MMHSGLQICLNAMGT